MEWVCVYLTLIKNLPVLDVGEDNYKTEEACINANAGKKDTFWCVTRNWLDEGQRKSVRAFVTDRARVIQNRNRPPNGPDGRFCCGGWLGA